MFCKFVYSCIMVSDGFQFLFLFSYLMLTVLLCHDLLDDKYHDEAHIDCNVEVDDVEKVPTDFISSIRIWNVICEVEHHDAEEKDA